jgi:hypothetical protein
MIAEGLHVRSRLQASVASSAKEEDTAALRNRLSLSWRGEASYAKWEEKSTARRGRGSGQIPWRNGV